VYVLFDALLREIVAINVFLLTKTTCGSWCIMLAVELNAFYTENGETE
jgi:hypothetical protein